MGGDTIVNVLGQIGSDQMPMLSTVFLKASARDLLECYYRVISSTQYNSDQIDAANFGASSLYHRFVIYNAHVT